MGRANSETTRGHLAPLVRPDDGQHRRSGRNHDRRAGQTLGRGTGRNRICRELHRMVRRRGKAHLRRCYPLARCEHANCCFETTDWCHSRDYTMEFSSSDDHAQGWPRACRRLSDDYQTCQRHPVDRARIVPPCRRSGHSQRHIVLHHGQCG